MQILAVLHERELDYYANVTSLDLYGNLIMSGRMRFCEILLARSRAVIGLLS